MSSLHKQYEQATAKYYGADKDPLKYPPVVSDKNVAHDLAIGVEAALSRIDEADLAQDAIRAQARNKYNLGETDLDKLKQSALDDRLRMAVVNTEIEHARRAPGDFNQDQEQSGAYEMGLGIITNLPPNQPPDVPDPRRGE